MTGNTVASGYFKNAEATEKAFRDGWLYSGDIAVVHPDGYLEIRDRPKDLVYVETEYGWENVSSIEIEGVLTRIPTIQDAAVLGLSTADGADTRPLLVAFLERQVGSHISESDVHAYCERALPTYKRPNAVFFAQLPKTSTGKVRKDILSADAAQLLIARRANTDGAKTVQPRHE